jgi:hypothetical protein
MTDEKFNDLIKQASPRQALQILLHVITVAAIYPTSFRDTCFSLVKIVESGLPQEPPQ